ncbi:hypothetical protein PM082_023656 [Marasmius tenuissimus]|nr:hypothetical protein PM082_023656 [Marasmius tenuissimus]
MVAGEMMKLPRWRPSGHWRPKSNRYLGGGVKSSGGNPCVSAAPEWSEPGLTEVAHVESGLLDIWTVVSGRIYASIVLL